MSPGTLHEGLVPLNKDQAMRLLAEKVANSGIVHFILIAGYDGVATSSIRAASGLTTSAPSNQLNCETPVTVGAILARSWVSP